MEDTKSISLGDKVESTVSGYSGVVTGICHYLHSETRYEVTLGIHEGEIKTAWFSLGELALTEE